MAEDEFSPKRSKIEITLNLCKYPHEKKFQCKEFSTGSTIADLECELHRRFDVMQATEVRLWRRGACNYQALNISQDTLQDMGVQDGETIILEEKRNDGVWPLDEVLQTSNRTVVAAVDSAVHSTTSSSHQLRSNANFVYVHPESSTSGSAGRSSSCTSCIPFYHTLSHTHPGLCGLTNLGNTCYMNSALQCLSNTQPLTKYFSDTEEGEKTFKKQINESNRLGSGGLIANIYCDLMDEQWHGRINLWTLKYFRTQLCGFAPQFAGHAQQDAQELMAILLDILHEDLNQVTKKPYLSAAVESEGRTDEEIAEESWGRHLRRNDSVIVHLFQGQLKAKTECSQCLKVFTAFDPFMFLTLPVPNETMNISVSVVRSNPDDEICKYQVTVPKNGTVEDLKTELSKLITTEAERMVIGSVCNGLFEQVYDGMKRLSRVSDKNIFAYELSHSLEDPEWRCVPVCHWEMAHSPTYSRFPVPDKYHRQRSYSRQEFFGIPMFVAVRKNQWNESDLCKVVLNRYRRYIATAKMEEPSFKISKLNFQSSPGMKPQVFSSGIDALEKLQQEMELCSLTATSRGCPQAYIGCQWIPEQKERYYSSAAEHVKDPPESCPKQNLHLMDCLKLFSEKQILNREQAWFCLNCKTLVEASRKYDLWKLPQTLMVHFKRFSNDRTRKYKLNSMIKFPISGLDLSEFVQNPDDPNPIYDLYAVCNHTGTVYGGHYTAYCKNKDTNKWYRFDDTDVSEIYDGQLETAAAYVLFYQRRTEAVQKLLAMDTYPEEDKESGEQKDIP